MHANENLGWSTAAEWLLGYTPDITVFLIFMFYEPVYYMDLEPSMADTTERLGRFVGISDSVGHSMTFMVLTEEDKIIHRASVRSADLRGEFTNIKAHKEAPSIATKARIEVLNGEASTVVHPNSRLR